MQTLVLGIFLVICNYITHAQEPKGVDINVQINNIKSNNGFILLGLHDQETFMARGVPALKRIKEEIKNGEIKVVFKNIPEGQYAIMVVHDENANNRMDFELNGMPKENYGTSNNEMSFGPPIFEDAKFKVSNENLDIEIRL